MTAAYSIIAPTTKKSNNCCKDSNHTKPTSLGRKANVEFIMPVRARKVITTIATRAGAAARLTQKLRYAVRMTSTTGKMKYRP